MYNINNNVYDLPWSFYMPPQSQGGNGIVAELAAWDWLSNHAIIVFGSAGEDGGVGCEEVNGQRW